MYNNKMKELADLDLVSKVKMIAPSHGQIFKDPSLIINKYNAVSYTHLLQFLKITLT